MKNLNPKKFVFVGERPSRTAVRRGWTWRDGHLAAKTLHEALNRSGINPTEQEYVNLFGEDCERDAGILEVTGRIQLIRRLMGCGYTAVGMGRRVCKRLGEDGISHLALRHPAARGKLRRRELYIEHVRQTLAPCETERKAAGNKSSSPTARRQATKKGLEITS